MDDFKKFISFLYLAMLVAAIFSCHYYAKYGWDYILANNLSSELSNIKLGCYAFLGILTITNVFIVTIQILNYRQSFIGWLVFVPVANLFNLLAIIFISLDIISNIFIHILLFVALVISFITLFLTLTELEKKISLPRYFDILYSLIHLTFAYALIGWFIY